jgi:ABC-2 type transporter
VPLPFSIHAYRTVYRNLIVLAHNAVIIPFGLILFRVPVTWHVIEIFPALLVLCINGLWISLLLGTISARFRDVPPIVANAVQVVFFITPIFWLVDAVGEWKRLLVLSPVFAAIDVVRAPLLGQATSPLLADTAHLHGSGRGPWRWLVRPVQRTHRLLDLTARPLAGPSRIVPLIPCPPSTCATCASSSRSIGAAAAR